MFGEISWANIIEGISITIGSTVVLALIYRFRRIIASWLKRRFNRLCRFMKISQCLPHHTLEYCRLIRERETLLARISQLESENEQIRLQQSKESPELEEAILQLLEFTLAHPRWDVTEALEYLGWGGERFDFVREEAERRKLLTLGIPNYFIMQAYLSSCMSNEAFRSHTLTHEGRELLFRKGRLH